MRQHSSRLPPTAREVVSNRASLKINVRNGGAVPCEKDSSVFAPNVWNGPVFSNAEENHNGNYENPPIYRGDIYYANLTPITGSEQGGIRPVLIIQNNVGNHHSPTVIAAAITGYVKGKRQPTHVRLKGAACRSVRWSCSSWR